MLYYQWGEKGIVAKNVISLMAKDESEDGFI